MPQKKPQDETYSAKNIQAITPREHIRRRPGMYVGGTDKRALHHLIWAATDHMIEEAMARLCTYIYVQILDSNKILIENDSAFLLDDVENIEQAFNDLLVELKWRTNVSDVYFGVQGGLHTIGLGIVNGLSESFRLEIEREGACWCQQYRQGLATEDVQYLKTDNQTKQRTRMIFSPDFEILDENVFDIETIATRFKDLSYLMPSIGFQVDEIGLQNQRYISQQGLADWVYDSRIATALHDVISGEATCRFINKAGENYKVIVQFAFQFTTSDTNHERSFINTVPSPDGGTHIEGLHKAILDCAFEEVDDYPNWVDIEQGFVGIVHLLHPYPEFEGRQRMKITNSDAYEVVDKAVKQAIAETSEQFDKVRDLLLKRV